MDSPCKVIQAAPIICPSCGNRHVDEGEWIKKPHHTHLCENCGLEFNLYSYGVRESVLEAQLAGAAAKALEDAALEAATIYVYTDVTRWLIERAKRIRALEL
jgi:transposase